MNQNRFTRIIIVIGVVIFIAIAGYFISTQRAFIQEPTMEVSSFEECAKAGYPVGESYPRQCWTPDGGHFVEKLIPSSGISPQEPITISDGGCVISGCSSEICGEEERMSICIFRPEYACYKDAKCGRQENGQCGWTVTKELNNCLVQKDES